MSWWGSLETFLFDLWMADQLQDHLREFFATLENVAFALCELQKVVKWIFLDLPQYVRGFTWG